MNRPCGPAMQQDFFFRHAHIIAYAYPCVCRICAEKTWKTTTCWILCASLRHWIPFCNRDYLQLSMPFKGTHTICGSLVAPVIQPRMALPGAKERLQLFSAQLLQEGTSVWKDGKWLQIIQNQLAIIKMQIARFKMFHPCHAIVI